MLLNIFIDGASRGNPGPAGIGIVVKNSKGAVVKNIKRYLGETTNNIAEYKAFICALQQAHSLKAKEISVNTDSRLLVNQLNRNFKVKDVKIKVLYNEALALIRNFDKVKVAYIDRAQNKDADKLANQAIDSSKAKKNELSDVAIFDNRQGPPESLF